MGTRFSPGTLSLLGLYILVIEEGKATLGLEALIFTNRDNAKAANLGSAGVNAWVIGFTPESGIKKVGLAGGRVRIARPFTSILYISAS